MTEAAARPARTVGSVSAVGSVLLLGPDHPALRETAARGLPAWAGQPGGGTLGAALSAGWLPKAVPAVEPNEDGVLLMAGRAGLLLAVADGHGGSAAAVGALRAVAAAAATALAGPIHGAAEHSTGRPGRGAAAGESLINALAAAAVTGVVDVPEPARTALGLVLVLDDAVLAVTYGDTATVLVRRGRARVVGGPSDFLGPETSGGPDECRPVVRRRRRPGDVVAVVSDGVPDYLGRAFPAAVAAAARPGGRQVTDATAVARALVDRAGTAGAGDNITAAVLLPGAAAPWRSRRRPRRSEV